MKDVINEFLLLEEDKEIEFMLLSWALCCDERLAMLCGALDGECTENLRPEYSNDMQLYYQDYLVMMEMNKSDDQFLVFFNEKPLNTQVFNLSL